MTVGKGGHFPKLNSCAKVSELMKKHNNANNGFIFTSSFVLMSQRPTDHIVVRNAVLPKYKLQSTKYAVGSTIMRAQCTISLILPSL